MHLFGLETSVDSFSSEGAQTSIFFSVLDLEYTPNDFF